MDKQRIISLISRVDENLIHLLTHIDFVIGLLEPKESSDKYLMAKKQMFKAPVMDSRGFLQEIKNLVEV